MKNKPNVVTKPTKSDAKYLDRAARSFILHLVIEKLTIPEGGCFIAGPDVYEGKEAQAILNKTIQKVWKAIRFSPAERKEIWGT